MTTKRHEERYRAAVDRNLNSLSSRVANGTISVEKYAGMEPQLACIKLGIRWRDYISRDATKDQRSDGTLVDVPMQPGPYYADVNRLIAARPAPKPAKAKKKKVEAELGDGITQHDGKAKVRRKAGRKEH